jgi:hypothetical protein
MRLACVTMAFKEERFMPKFIQAMQNRVDEILVLNTEHPWFGAGSEPDNTANIARSLGVSVIQYDWQTEHEQRNAGQEYLADYDWIITLDPDEFIVDEDWAKLVKFLECATVDAFVCQMQNTYWKKGFVIDPPEDYTQIIATRPCVRYFDKRCVDRPFGLAPVNLHHFSWARTDEECLKKISTYGHAHELDPNWYKDVWSSDKTEDLHPLTPESLKRAIRVELPEELERLDLWPS